MKKVSMTIVIMLLSLILTGCVDYNIVRKNRIIVGGDFDYATNDTIYFKNETGFWGIQLGAGNQSSVHWDGSYFNPNQYIREYEVNGFDCSVLSNKSIKCITIHVLEYRNFTNHYQNGELERIIVTYDSDSPEVVYSIYENDYYIDTYGL